MKKLLDRLKRFDKLVGVELYIGPDQSRLYNVIVIEKKRDQLDILTSKSGLKSINEINSVEDIHKLPIVLVINGKSILSKKIAANNYTEENPISSIIPNANVEEFTFETQHSDNVNWVNIIRKELFEAILEEFNQAKLNVIDVSLGVTCIESIYSLLENVTTVETTGYQLEFSEGYIEEIKPDKSDYDLSYQIGNDEIDYTLVPAFAKVFTKFLKIEPNLFNAQALEESKENYWYNYYFNKLKWGGLIGIFGLLLINFICFSYLNNQNQKSSLELSLYENQIQQLTSLKSRYKEKQSFFKQNSVLRPSKKSWYADQIASSIQTGIELRQIQIAPPSGNKTRSYEKQYLFDHKKMLIKGVSQRSLLLNSWINEMQSFDWLEQVNVLPYSETSSGKGEFELELILK